MRQLTVFTYLGLSLLLAYVQDAILQELIAPPPAPVPSSTGMHYTAPPRIPPTPSEIASSEAYPSQEPVAAYSLEELLVMAAKHNPTLR
ncbi:hypothetical protein [Bythopirellula goksoeyrii]|uniref:Uncharacterized protein n=1 Tax=Bythopirellula goksoeyrii TaxID=1400387 RepID=A0A5B9QMP3_9BACT|nr:hypothetical protein [Bythopirellula goksoeyrii]QEG35391.1 hypothetical protein Pr1d_26890 [Bythopirellula goksoeyrii]